MSNSMERVLRAMDVIPPFEDDLAKTPPATQGTQKDRAVPRIQPWGQTRKQSSAQNKTPSPPNTSDDEAARIPALDLGEKILAEQRRMTARKRKAPGTAQVESGQDQPPSVVAMRAERAVEPSAHDLAQLEQLVAEIVARDIDRLCSRPAGAIA